MEEARCRKCGVPCARNMTISGIGPVCITCFMSHKEKPFWEKLHNKMDNKNTKVARGQVTLNDL